MRSVARFEVCACRLLKHLFNLVHTNTTKAPNLSSKSVSGAVRPHATSGPRSFPILQYPGLHTVLRHLKYEVEAPESPLNRDRSIWGRQLAPIIGDCDFTLRQLDGLLQKYGRLNNSSSSSSPSSPRILWDKVRFGSNEMDTLGTIRVKLISHKTSLTLFLDTIQLRESGKMSQALDNHGGQLDVILDKVDGIAARMAPPRREGSVLTSYDDDDREVWKQFRRELIAEGFSSDVLQQHKACCFSDFGEH